MQTVPEPSSTVQFDSALRTLAARATERYAGEKARIDRGLVIALNHGVTLHYDGTASVQSATDPFILYHVAHGTCDCPDFERAPGGRCKHRFAVCLVTKATAQVQHEAQYYTTTTEAQGTVCGGHRATADAQRAQEEAEGGLVARICGYAKTVTTVIATAVLAVSLLAGSVDAKPRPAPAAIQEVAMVGTDPREYGVLVLVNETLPARAVIDTGATSFYLPYEVYQRLAATGTVMRADVLPKTTYTVVGGQTFTAHRILVTLTLGGYRIPNVEATIGTTGGDILLGSSVLQRFQSFGIDHTRGILRLGQPR